MKRLGLVAIIAIASLNLAACGGGGSSTRTIEVDYHSDDFAGSFLGFYPREVTVTPGMTVKFHQTWTGEPHSVTFGKLLDDKGKALIPLLDDYATGRKPIPNEPPPEYDMDFWDGKLPHLFGQGDGLGQDAAYPCYVKTEKQLPLDHAKCAAADQKQPEFNGEYALYSSGFIPFEGERGNTFEMKIADDTKDGTYFYYCNVHGVLMGGKVTVKIAPRPVQVTVTFVSLSSSRSAKESELRYAFEAL